MSAHAAKDSRTPLRPPHGSASPGPWVRAGTRSAPSARQDGSPGPWPRTVPGTSDRSAGRAVGSGADGGRSPYDGPSAVMSCSPALVRAVPRAAVRSAGTPDPGGPGPVVSGLFPARGGRAPRPSERSWRPPWTTSCSRSTAARRSCA
ncbi:hypothetical protein HMPREF0682_0836 [Propionibacterium acidifaciens F0233]|uniref:Uncharacterized protein n=1 Tax=Propionibacterium acidifaciens F0233 TaxID=553198 RepID=U2QMQ4_9ACTN|nr:hypothetical protein HMPREF0682_0836 [Propionibacterium acidifaciens F0233]